jgi:Cu+-exporting ATPase
VGIKNIGALSDDRLIAILASLEDRSEHPIARALVQEAKVRNLSLLSVENFLSHKGKGVSGEVDGVSYFAGNSALMDERGVTLPPGLFEKETRDGKTPIMLAQGKELLSVVFVSDAVKPEAKDAIAKLLTRGMQIVMLSGDNEETARAIGREVGITTVIAGVSPEEKLTHIQALRKKGHVVGMVGDGVNDAPALAAADVGIAMGTGTDVAIESAGITLLHGNLSKLVEAITLSHLTMSTIKQNLFFAFIYNIIGIPLAGGLLYPFFGILLSPVFAGLAMAFSSVSVVLNALRLRTRSLS